MPAQHRFVVCSNHAAELKQALRAEGAGDVEVATFPARCGRGTVSEADLPPAPDKPSTRCILGGACLDGSARSGGAEPGDDLGNCLQHFVDGSVLESWIRDGAYAVGPGWLAGWRGHIRQWGFDQATAQRFFAETTSYILLVDTGVDPDAQRRLEDFADFLDLPARRVEVGLGHLAMLVREQLLRWQLERAEPNETHEASEYALALSLIGRLAGVGTEDEVVDRIFDLFAMLCGAHEMAWLPFGERGRPTTRPALPATRLDALRASSPQDAITPGGRLTLRIGPPIEPLALLELAAFDRPDRLKEYMNLALSLRGPLELAVRTARSWQEVEHARALLAQQADGYRILADSADGLVVYAGAGRVEFANPAAEQLLGTGVGAHLTLDLEKGSVEVVGEDGVQRVIDARVVSVEWEGHPARLASLRDVTEQRSAEEAVRRTQKMTLLGQLASSVAHDFNNVLQAIGGSLEVAAAEQGLAASTRSRIDDAAAAAERGSAIARRLLLFSSPTARPQRTVDVAAELQRMAPLLRQLAGERVRFELRSPTEGLHVGADDGQLEAVVLNLVTNAGDACKAGGLVLVEARADDDHVLLAVSDEGPGIPEQLQRRIFEPFFTTKGPDRGTGLGLPTARAAVERMGGTLALRSEPGRGTRFEARVPQAQPAHEAPRDPVAAPSRRPARAGRVLLVDDEETIRETLATALRGCGHEVLTAGSAPDALQLLAETGPDWDLLLTDVSMPGMDGFELAREAAGLRPGLRVLFMSGLADASFPGLDVDPARIAVLARPFRLGQAVQRVEEVMGPLEG